jgi:hypothetical protein
VSRVGPDPPTKADDTVKRLRDFVRVREARPIPLARDRDIALAE